jgi:hypothetical protein
MCASRVSAAAVTDCAAICLRRGGRHCAASASWPPQTAEHTLLSPGLPALKPHHHCLEAVVGSPVGKSSTR